MAFPAEAGLKFFLADLVAISAGVRYTAETVEVWRIGDKSCRAEVCTII